MQLEAIGIPLGHSPVQQTIADPLVPLQPLP